VSANGDRPPPNGDRLWEGDAYREGMAVQRQANAMTRKGRRGDHPDQTLLPGLFQAGQGVAKKNSE
jgi:hypothetical protein